MTRIVSVTRVESSKALSALMYFLGVLFAFWNAALLMRFEQEDVCCCRKMGGPVLENSNLGRVVRTSSTELLVLRSCRSERTMK